VISPPPKIPWQVTGNHWLTVPCIHPADASIHLLGALHAQSRAAIEFAGDAGFLDGNAAPLAQLFVVVDGEVRLLGSESISWEREFGWIPTFSCRIGDLLVRGTICAPHGRNADMAGVVIAISLQNKGEKALGFTVGLRGTLGHRQLRIRTAREFADEHAAIAGEGNSIMLEGRARRAHSPLQLAVKVILLAR
jgi:hypothetical protein